MESSERTFEKDDKLNRKKYADFLTTIIENCDHYKRDDTNGSYVIAIDSPWGTGKTWFIDMWCNSLKGNENLCPIRYNVRENDFWDNAFEPLMYSILNSDLLKNELNYESKKKDGKQAAVKLVLASTQIIKGITKGYVNHKSGTEKSDLFDKVMSLQYDSFKKYVMDKKDVFKEYKTFMQNVDELKKALSYTIHLLCRDKKGKKDKKNVKPKSDEDQKKDNKIVLIIDDLDRCKPSFAVQTLEVIKLVFDIPNLVVLFALDMHQLGYSIKAVYGQDIDTIGYIVRTFDYISKIPKHSNDEFIKALIKDRPLENIKLFGDQSLSKTQPYAVFVAFFIKISTVFQLSLKDIKTIYNSFLVFEQYEIKSNTSSSLYELYLAMMLLKYKLPVYFDALIMSRFEISSTLQNITEALSGASDVFSGILGDITAGTKLSEMYLRKINDKMTEHLKISTITSTEIVVFRPLEEITTISNESLRIPFEPDCVINDFLAYDDMLRWDEIKDFTVGQFLHRKLEMFDFSFIQKNQVSAKELPVIY
jgi:hypothetical protein